MHGHVLIFLKEDMEKGNLEKAYFEYYKWNDLMKLIEDPILYHTEKMKEASCRAEELEKIKKSTSYKIGRIITFIPRKVIGGYNCIKDHGIFYTVGYAVKKFTRG